MSVKDKQYAGAIIYMYLSQTSRKLLVSEAGTTTFMKQWSSYITISNNSRKTTVSEKQPFHDTDNKLAHFNKYKCRVMLSISEQLVPCLKLDYPLYGQRVHTLRE